MKPFYQSDCGTITLYLGDCRDIEFPKESIAITDPPYNISNPKLIKNFKDKKTGVLQDTLGKDFNADFDEESISPNQWAKMMPNTVAAFYGAKKMGELIQTFKETGYEIVQDFHWCKSNVPPPLRGIGFAWGTESGYVFRKIGTKHAVNKKAGYSPNFFVAPAQHIKEKQDHSTQKPINVMNWLVRFFSIRGNMIVDPFMGSGVTGVVSVRSGRKFIGVEKKEKYCLLAMRRIKQALQDYQNGFDIED